MVPNITSMHVKIITDIYGKLIRNIERYVYIFAYKRTNKMFTYLCISRISLDLAAKIFPLLK